MISYLQFLGRGEFGEVQLARLLPPDVSSSPTSSDNLVMVKVSIFVWKSS